MRKTNDAGIELIKSFEGLQLESYQDSVGVWTIGYGHTGGDVKHGQHINEEQAEELLRKDLATAEKGVADAIHTEITDNQFAASVSLAFNVGVSAFKHSSIVKMINAGDTEAAADRFLLFNKAGGVVLPGLVRRRKAERELFLTPDHAEPLPVAVSTETTTTTITGTPAATTVVEEKSSLVIPSQVKEIAGTGLSTIGNKLATGGISTGVLSAIGAFVEKAWPMLIFAAVLIILGVAVWMLVYHNQHKEKQMEGQIASDPGRVDIKFIEKKK